MAITPADKPKYLYLVLTISRRRAPGDGGYHTAAYNAGRVTGALIRASSRSRACAALRPPDPAVPADRAARLRRDADKVGKE